MSSTGAYHRVWKWLPADSWAACGSERQNTWCGTNPWYKRTSCQLQIRRHFHHREVRSFDCCLHFHQIRSGLTELWPWPAFRGNMGNVGASLKFWLFWASCRKFDCDSSTTYLTVLLELSCHVKFELPDKVPRFIDFCPRFAAWYFPKLNSRVVKLLLLLRTGILFEIQRELRQKILTIKTRKQNCTR